MIDFSTKFHCSRLVREQTFGAPRLCNDWQQAVGAFMLNCAHRALAEKNRLRLAAERREIEGFSV